MLDKRILEQLFRRNYSEMIHLARVMLGDDGEAEDVVQDIFLRIADSDIPPKNDSYLLTAVRNACLNEIRQMQLHERVKNLLPTENEIDQQPIDKQQEQLDNISAFVDEQLEEPQPESEYRLQVSRPKHSENQKSLQTLKEYGND